MVYQWKDANGKILRVVEVVERKQDQQHKRLQFQIENRGDVETFWFDAPGDFLDFVAVMTDLAKQVYGLDFAKILKMEEKVDADGTATASIRAEV